MAYFVLAGGFPAVSEKITGRRMDLSPEERIVDFIIQIDGLPKEFFIPTQITRKKSYYCNQCKREVPDVEVELRTGCFMHGLEVKEKLVESWDTAVFEQYEISTLRYLKPMYRIWLHNSQGEEKWRLIYKYIQTHYPAHKMIPEPIPTGNRQQWLATIETIPYIDLNTSSEEVEMADAALRVKAAEDKPVNEREITNARGMYECHVCGKELTTYKGLGAHIRASHDGIMEKAKARVRAEALAIQTGAVVTPPVEEPK
jgi:predicted SprT family Zn-dependent metalloprotease